MTTNSNARQPDMTIRKVAESLSLHPETVRKMARQGAFPNAYKVGGTHSSQIRIPWSDVEDYRRLQPKVSC